MVIYATVNTENIVEGISVYEDAPTASLPTGWTYVLVAADAGVGIGDTYNPTTHVFTKAPPTQDQIDAETRGQIIALAKQAMAQLTTIINRTQPTFNTIAQAQTWARQAQQDIQYEAHVLRRLIRLAGGLLDGTD